jgi:hypothetical protein
MHYVRSFIFKLRGGENDLFTPLKSALLDFESNERLLYIPAS